MGRKNALGSLIGGGEGSRDAASEAARDIDWMKIRRVQHGLYRPTDSEVDSNNGWPGLEAMGVAEVRRRWMARLANLLGILSGFLFGVAILRGLSEASLLLAVALLLSIAGTASALRGAL